MINLRSRRSYQIYFWEEVIRFSNLCDINNHFILYVFVFHNINKNCIKSKLLFSCFLSLILLVFSLQFVTWFIFSLLYFIYKKDLSSAFKPYTHPFLPFLIDSGCLLKYKKSVWCACSSPRSMQCWWRSWIKPRDLTRNSTINIIGYWKILVYKF